jgi:DNA-binding NtrC family response regulator
MKEGAYDFITKPVDASHFDIVVRKLLERESLKRELELVSEDADRRYRLVIGQSAKMKEAVETARKAATSKATVLLLGESGTGKEIFARAIHSWSERKNQPFVAINCVGLSKELLESELFGHEKGSFTGADQLKKGKMELANGGTVFLDEVGDVSQELQTKLLRFLQEREFDRIGGSKPIRVDVRIVAATNRDLDLAVKEGRFREDLYHRLNVVPIILPPLRERREDIPSLAHHFLQRFAQEVKKNFSQVSEDALGKLSAYDWPGNVRELANVVERAVVLGQGPEIAPHDLPARIAAVEPNSQPDNLPYRDAMEVYRKQLVMRALTQAQGNRAAAARSLGLHEKYFLRLLKSLGIS